MIIYLHGFRSSANSLKAEQLKTAITRTGSADEIWCENLPDSPRDAMILVGNVIQNATSRPLLVGSSLGGYYATYLAEHYDLEAVLINPACKAFDLLSPWIGPHANLYTGRTFELTEAHIQELRTLWVPVLSRPSRFWVLMETGDEVLDYRVALNTYEGAEFTVIQGGNHGLKSFPQFIPEIIRRSTENKKSVAV